MDEAIEVMLQVTGALERLGVPYLVGGSMASSLYGQPRLTQDVDVVADLQIDDVPALVSALQGEFYVDEAAVREAVVRRSTFNVIHLRTLFKADIFVAGDQPATRRELERCRKFVLNVEPAAEIMVASPEDIIVQKLYWYRLGDHVSDRQWSDAMNVLEIRGSKLDLAYMHELAAEMGVSDLLARALEKEGLGR